MKLWRRSPRWVLAPCAPLPILDPLRAPALGSYNMVAFPVRPYGPPSPTANTGGFCIAVKKIKLRHWCLGAGETDDRPLVVSYISLT